MQRLRLRLRRPGQRRRPRRRKTGPNQAKHCALPWNINKCRHAVKYKRMAESAVNDARSRHGSGWKPGRYNALRHLIYAALNAKNNGKGFARAHLHAHEQDNDDSYGPNPCKGKRNRRKDTRVDKHNSEWGVGLAGGMYKHKSDKLLLACSKITSL